MSAPSAARLLRRTFSVEPLGCNCTIVACPDTREAIVIDPGGEAPRILEELRVLGVTAVRIVHTHAHFDHVLATSEVAAATRAEVALHRDDRWLYDHVPMQLDAFGLASALPSGTTGGPGGQARTALRALAGDEVLPFGRREARALHTPGHTPGSMCFFVETDGAPSILFSGDTLFASSIGRTDLWGGDHDALLRSIRGPLFALPDDTLVVPGHGPETTIGFERQGNPFVGRFARG